MRSGCHRLLLLTVAAAATTFAPAAATASWTRPQDIRPNGCCASPVSIASNARGDVVAAFTEAGGVSVARARAHRRFGPRVRLVSEGYSGASVAIDERGVALVAFAYDDRTDPGHFEGRGDDGCCTGIKVVVWRPGRRPTRPRAILAPGTSTLGGMVAATRGHRGVLVVGERGGTAFGSGRRAPVRLAPVRLDGRIGRLRTVANRSWTPTTLQWHRGRAVAGLQRSVGGSGFELGSARQGSRGAFLPARRFARVPAAPQDPLARSVEMTPDGRGGHVTVWRRATSAGERLVLARASRRGRLRTTLLARGGHGDFRFARPAVASDGWIVVAWAQADDAALAAYVTTRSPRGRLVTSRILGPRRSAPIVRPVDHLTAAAAPGGRGAVAVNFEASGWAMRIVGLRAGRPAPGAVLDLRSALFPTPAVLTANARDPARALFESNRISPDVQDFRVRESRLR